MCVCKFERMLFYQIVKIHMTKILYERLKESLRNNIAYFQYYSQFNLIFRPLFFYLNRKTIATYQAHGGKWY